MKELISLLHASDIVEISIIFILISTPLLWLSKSKTPLLEIVYSTMGLWLLSVHYPMPALQSVLYSVVPCVVLGMLLTHKKALQQTYLVAQTPQSSANWIELCLKSFMQTKNGGLYDYCIIEGNQSLEAFLYAHPIMHLAINADVLTLINDQTAHAWWISKQGVLRSAHASINPQATLEQSSMYESLCTMASQTDCCILIKKNDESLSLLYAHKLIETISLSSALRCIKQHLHQTESTYDKKIYKEYSL